MEENDTQNDVNGSPPPTNRMQIEAAGIDMSGVGVVTGPHPTRPDHKAIILGPLFLIVPLNEENVRAVVQGLTGVQIATEMPKQFPE